MGTSFVTNSLFSQQKLLKKNLLIQKKRVGFPEGVHRHSTGRGKSIYLYVKGSSPIINSGYLPGGSRKGEPQTEEQIWDRAHPFRIFTAPIFIGNLTFHQGWGSPSTLVNSLPVKQGLEKLPMPVLLLTQRSSHFWSSPSPALPRL